MTGADWGKKKATANTQFQGPLPSVPYPPVPAAKLPQIQLESLGERCKLPQWGSGRSPGRERILAYFEPRKRHCVLDSMLLLQYYGLSCMYASDGNNFGSYFTSHYSSENDNVHIK